MIEPQYLTALPVCATLPQDTPSAHWFLHQTGRSGRSRQGFCPAGLGRAAGQAPLSFLRRSYHIALVLPAAASFVWFRPVPVPVSAGHGQVHPLTGLPAPATPLPPPV